MSKVTMRDLGRMLGVSAVTVSKALAGKSGMSEELRGRIIALAEETGYVNPKQAPQHAPEQDVGILVPEYFFTNDNFYAMFYKQLTQALLESGRFGLLELVSADMQRSRTLPNLLRGSRVGGLILLGQLEEGYVRLLAAQGLPLVCLDFCYPALPVDAVVGDNLHGAALMTRHLIQQGHRDIGFLGNGQATTSIMERCLGFAAEMMRRQLPIRPEWMLSDRTDENVIQMPPLPERMPTAFLCNCDVAARPFIEHLRQAGYRVPEDVSIVSYDDFNNEFTPLPLTTFRVDTAAMCRIAVQRLASRLAGESGPHCRVVVGGEGVYRESVVSR